MCVITAIKVGTPEVSTLVVEKSSYYYTGQIIISSCLQMTGFEGIKACMHNLDTVNRVSFIGRCSKIAVMRVGTCLN